MKYRDARKLLTLSEKHSILVTSDDGVERWLLTKKALDDAETARQYMGNKECIVSVTSGKAKRSFLLCKLNYVEKV